MGPGGVAHQILARAGAEPAPKNFFFSPTSTVGGNRPGVPPTGPRWVFWGPWADFGVVLGDFLVRPFLATPTPGVPPESVPQSESGLRFGRRPRVEKSAKRVDQVPNRRNTGMIFIDLCRFRALLSKFRACDPLLLYEMGVGRSVAG